jgi:hypothetical protein
VAGSTKIGLTIGETTWAELVIDFAAIPAAPLRPGQSYLQTRFRPNTRTPSATLGAACVLLKVAMRVSKRERDGGTNAYLGVQFG